MMWVIYFFFIRPREYLVKHCIVGDRMNRVYIFQKSINKQPSPGHIKGDLCGAFIVDPPTNRGRMLTYIYAYRATSYSYWLPENLFYTVWQSKTDSLTGIKLAMVERSMKKLKEKEEPPLLEEFTVNRDLQLSTIDLKLDDRNYIVPEYYAKLCDKLGRSPFKTFFEFHHKINL